MTRWTRCLPVLLLAALSMLTGCGPGEPERGAGPREAAAPAGRPGGTPAQAGGPAKKADDGWPIVWRRAHGPDAEVVRIGAGAVAIGPLGGQARRYLFAEPEHTRELFFFTRTYAPFRLRAGGGVLELRSQGTVQPGPGERRMVFEWARQVAAEAGGVEPGSGFGLLLIWQRVSGSGCDEVTVYLSGEVRAGRCGGHNPIAGRLAPGPLTWLYGRFDRLAAFQAAAEPVSLGISPRLVFAGRGRETVTAEDRRELEGFGAALAREVTPRRPAPLPAETPPAGRNARNGKTRTAEATRPESPAGPRLLLPPQRVLPLPEVILPDDRLPPPPPVPVRREPAAGQPGG